MGVSLLYATTFLWRLNRGLASSHEKIQSVRPLLGALDALPVGSVLSNPELSGLITLYTKQRPFWIYRAYMDEVSNQEMHRRWMDAMSFFSNDPMMSDGSIRRSLYSYGSIFCNNQTERFVYLPLKEAGILRKTVCREGISDSEWADVIQQAMKSAVDKEALEAWKPHYRLDYLVLDHTKREEIPAPLKKNFVLVSDDGRFAIYSFRVY